MNALDRGMGIAPDSVAPALAGTGQSTDATSSVCGAEALPDTTFGLTHDSAAPVGAHTATVGHTEVDLNMSEARDSGPVTNNGNDAAAGRTCSDMDNYFDYPATPVARGRSALP